MAGLGMVEVGASERGGGIPFRKEGIAGSRRGFERERGIPFDPSFGKGERWFGRAGKASTKERTASCALEGRKKRHGWKRRDLRAPGGRCMRPLPRIRDVRVRQGSRGKDTIRNAAERAREGHPPTTRSRHKARNRRARVQPWIEGMRQNPLGRHPGDLQATAMALEMDVRSGGGAQTRTRLVLQDGGITSIQLVRTKGQV